MSIILQIRKKLPKKLEAVLSKIEIWVISVSVAFSLIHLKVESLNVGKFPSINDFKLTVFYITNHVLGFLSLSGSRHLSLSPCPLAVCSADKHRLLLKKASWVEEAEVNCETRRQAKSGSLQGPPGKKREAGQQHTSVKYLLPRVRPAQSLRLIYR